MGCVWVHIMLHCSRADVHSSKSKAAHKTESLKQQ
uniref:Uncharacterized protein n=1 Tax=Anguilla anguilla TaxID=7936 RepID=A0A0E9WMH9_ANGAN